MTPADEQFDTLAVQCESNYKVNDLTFADDIALLENDLT